MLNIFVIMHPAITRKRMEKIDEELKALEQDGYILKT